MTDKKFRAAIKAHLENSCFKDNMCALYALSYDKEVSSLLGSMSKGPQEVIHRVSHKVRFGGKSDIISFLKSMEKKV